MNINRKAQIIPQVWINEAKDFAARLIAHYANGGSPQSRAVSGGRGVETDPVRQAQAKIGEAAVALYFDLDPDVAVSWQRPPAEMKPDNGGDIILPSGLILDVKTTLPPFNLIWSRDVNDFYHKKVFDALVSVSIEEDDWRQCHIEGWVSKARFFQKKRIADGVKPRLEPGTWFLDKSDLADIDLLKSEPSRLAVIFRKQFEYVQRRWPNERAR